MRGLARELVLVSPRAGFGKAALLADWVRRGNRPVDQIPGAHSPTIPVWRRTRIPATWDARAHPAGRRDRPEGWLLRRNAGAPARSQPQAPHAGARALLYEPAHRQPRRHHVNIALHRLSGTCTPGLQAAVSDRRRHARAGQRADAVPVHPRPGWPVHPGLAAVHPGAGPWLAGRLQMLPACSACKRRLPSPPGSS